MGVLEDKQNIIALTKKRHREYHNQWQNTKYKNDPKFREKKKKIAVEWREKNIEKFREYQRNYQKKRRMK